MLPPYTIDPQQPKSIPQGHASNGHGSHGNGHGSSHFGALIPMPATELMPTGGYPLPAGPSAATLVPNVTAGNLLHSLRRRWWLGAGVGLLVALLFAVAGWYLVPSHQEVSALLHINRDAPQVLDTNYRYVQEAEFEAYKGTQAGLIKQKMNIRAALAQTDPETGLELARNREVQKHPDPERWLEESLDVQSPEKSDLMFVSLSGDDPKELVKIVNAVCKTYLEQVKETDHRAGEREFKEITAKYEQTERALAEAQQKLSLIAKEAKVGTKEAMAVAQNAKTNLFNTKNNHLMQLERDFMSVKDKLLESQVELQVAQTLVVTEGQLEHELRKDEIYQEKKKSLDALKKDFHEAEGKVKNPNSAKLKNLRGPLEEMEREIDEYKEEMRPIIEEHLKGPDRVAKLEGEIKYLSQQKAELEEAVKAARTEIATLQTELESLGENSPAIEKLAHEIHMMERDMTQLGEAKLKLELASKQSSRIWKVADATVPETASEKFKYIAVAFAAFFGFCLPIVGITFWDFQQHRVNRPYDASSALGLKILGALPAVAGRKGRQAAQPGKAIPTGGLQRLLADSVDGVRTALLRDSAAEGTRVVLVSSATHHEGKTTLASQLATSLARAGKRTLLMDGDLRKPFVHRMFGLSLDPGICEVLRGECELEETIRPTRASGLWMMTAGRSDDDTGHELAKDGVDEIFKQLRTGFDYIVIDSSPVLTTADALVIGQYVDAVILSVLRDASRVPLVFEACDRLRGVGIRILGTVFNGTKQESSPKTTTKRIAAAKAASL